MEDKSIEGGQSKNASECDEKQQLFLSRLEEAVANGGTKNLWRQYGNRITMQFKDRNLEAKVRGENVQLHKNFIITVFCLHWSVVVGPTTTQPLLTTTQASFAPPLSLLSPPLIQEKLLNVTFLPII